MILSDIINLIGNWSGSGVALIPGASNTPYKDSLIFEFDSSKNLIFYIHRTKYDLPGKENDTLHIESGFIKQTDEGTIELSNSQNDGRVEVMVLEYCETENESLKLKFISKLFGNDPRMLRTTREFIVTENTLTYEMKMATQMNNSLNTHLKAVLKRI